MFKRVLVPLDGSELAETVLPYVEELGKQCAAEAILLRVVPLPRDTATGSLFQTPFSLPGSDEDEVIARHPIHRAQEIESLRVETERSLARAKERLIESGLDTRVVVLFGRPAVRIIEYAAKGDVSLIAMTTHGRSGIGRWVFGGVADKVLRASGVPVLVVRPQQTVRPGRSPEAEVRVED